jgi:PA14 domain
MRRFLIILITILYSIMTYSQTGVGYLNYTIYNIVSNSVGQYANNANDFNNMFDLTKGATVYSSGISTANNLLYFNGGFFTTVPNGGNYFGIQTTGYFVPTVSGAYQFAITGDDAEDFLINGTVVCSDYGGHGFNGYQIGTINLIAGQVYTFTTRFQQWGGGWGMYLIWAKPDGSGWGVHPEEVYTKKPLTRSEKINFNFTSGFNPSSFSVNTINKNNNVWSINSSNTLSSLSSSGVVDISSSIDTTKIGNGYQASITAGQTEWSYVNIFNGVATLYIDLRQLSGYDPSTINTVSILDVYSGSVTYTNSDIYWAHYTLPSVPLKITDGTSTYNSNIRNAGYGNYAFSCNIGLSQVQIYKPQGVQFKSISTDSLNAMLSRVVTISDVYLAFKEYSAGGGLFGTGGSTYFTSGIQYMNADVNNDGVFDEKDCFRLLQFLTGQKSLLDTMVIGNFMKLSDTSIYNSVTKANWMTKSNSTTNSYQGIILQDAPNLTHNYYVNVYWKGDVNMSHSPAQTGQYANMSVSNLVNIKTMSVVNNTPVSTYVVTEMVNGNLVMTLTVNPGLNQIAGVQYKVNYDNSILSFTSSNFTTNGNPTNFATDKSSFINVGSLNMTGGFLDNTTKIVLVFTPKQSLNNSFGLLSISNQEAINLDGLNVNNLIK